VWDHILTRVTVERVILISERVFEIDASRAKEKLEPPVPLSGLKAPRTLS